MLSIMTTNWLVLFGITYLKYGWDVGEPVSYLTSLTVDLAAMIGYFDLEKSIQEKIGMENGLWRASLNLETQVRAQSWLLSYYRRQYY